MSIEPQRTANHCLALDTASPDEGQLPFSANWQGCLAVVDQWSALLDLSAAS